MGKTYNKKNAEHATRQQSNRSRTKVSCPECGSTNVYTAKRTENYLYCNHCGHAWGWS